MKDNFDESTTRTSDTVDYVNLKKLIDATELYIEAVAKHIDSKNNPTYPLEMKRELVESLSTQWLEGYARNIFPKIDEFEVKKGWVIKHPDHDTRKKHRRFTIRQVRAWVGTEKHRLGLVDED